MGGNLTLLLSYLHYAKQKKIRVSLNPGLKEIEHRDELIPLLPMAEILFVNREEAARLWDVDYSDSAYWKRLDGPQGSKVVVMTDGDSGGKVCTDGKCYFYETEKVKHVVDTTGAGDAFASGMIAGILYGKTYEQAVTWGVRDAVAKLKFVGAKRGLLTLAEINK